MGQRENLKGQNPPHIWYPPHRRPVISPLAEEGKGTINSTKPFLKPDQESERPTERDIAAADIWPLLPAAVGAGAAILLLLMGNHKQWKDENDNGSSNEESSDKGSSSEGYPERQDTPVGSAVVVLYSIIATAGVSYYVYRVLTATDGHILTSFVPVGSAIGLLLIYFAAAYDLEYHMVPGSFTGDHFGNDIVSELFTFVYFSITTFATASMGDFSPISNASRILVTLEVLFFIYIFTMGIVFFADP
ncbi:ABC-type multidrug transport system, ATPase and permease component [Desulfosporosinus acidiphilus SJ4]|uniref:ABC-type multidrug transport system, ATPase and permease component n=1 Tax=Desulfosporosinus acidiphilus (strain DSM 22704 / JCM 16185 / SJ4) TaxID=646529 RepID=I4D3L7_DESAJ|nr:potassium channel family protein [Desulfosporosinus acidiphilus]AFM40391.1 ABC-type multidrug transport system, ATPase and permease component [Desulfosporosinus acidiphilus SJ4]